MLGPMPRIRQGKRMSFFKPMKTRAWAMATVATVAISSSAFAEAASHFDVPAQPLSSALEAFGRQAGVSILFDRQELAGKSSAGLQGDYLPSEALKRLLQGTGARVEQPNATTFVVKMSGADKVSTVAPNPAPAETTEVVVTGSRVIRNGNNSPTPVTVVSTESLLKLQPTSVAEALSTLPAFAGSRVATGNPGTGTTNNAADVMNLRGLGFTRNLILVDGHRESPITQDGLVDISMIPQMLLKRVDVVTGGVSAVYGSDAVSGVVNFITDDTFNGFKLNLQGGESSRNDDHTYDAGVAFGQRLLDDRGHIEASFEYRDDPGIDWRSSRPFGAEDITVQGAGTNADPYHVTYDTRFNTNTLGGYFNTGPLAGMQFAQNGVVSAFDHGTATGTNGFESGGDGGYYDGSLKSSLRSSQFYGRFDYDFTDTLHGYASVSYTGQRTNNFGTWNLLNKVTLSSTNPFLSSAVQSQLAASPTFSFSQIMSDGSRVDTDSKTDQTFLVAGLNGKLGDGWKWEAAATHSDSRITTTDDSNIDNQKLSAALDAITDPTTGKIVCRVTVTNPGLYPGCVPLNPFGPTAASSAALNYIRQATTFAGDTTLDDLSASVNGTPLNDWAGPVKVALSGEWRRLGYVGTSTALPTDTVNCTGLIYNCKAGQLRWLDGTLANRPYVEQTVSEAAIEADVPLLKDLPLAQDVTMDVAARYTDYNTSGAATTWKIGIDWHFNDELKFRAATSRDIRAPNLNDLYQPLSVTTGNYTDLLTGQNPTVTVTAGGNPNLRPEVGHTTTAGFVYKPGWLPASNFAIDGYYIVIDGAITNVQGTNPTVQEQCYLSGGTSPYCQLQVRPDGYTDTSAANAATAFYSEVINISTIKTYGADFEANYATRAFDHPLTLRGLVTWQPHILYVQPGLQNVDMGGVSYSSNSLQASPKVRAMVQADYTVGPVSIDVQERWRSNLKWSGDPTQIFSTPPTPSVAYTNLNISYELKSHAIGDTQLFLNAQNLFDTLPPAAAFVGANGNIGVFGGYALGDDPIGRYITIGLRLRR